MLYKKALLFCLLHALPFFSSRHNEAALGEQPECRTTGTSQMPTPAVGRNAD